MSKAPKLGVWGAIRDALLSRTASYFPRFKDASGAARRIAEPQIVTEIVQALEDLRLPAGFELDPYLTRGRETLDEVKGLTEYQDQKATRLLTIVTFLSALSGAFFSRFADAYPLYRLLEISPFCASSVLVLLTYLGFIIFALSAACGALVVFHATRTRFKYPSLEIDDAGTRESHPGSYLFFSDIIELRPARWAQAFTVPDVTAPSGRTLDPELALRYLKNYIVESYLVAAKVADKLRYLQPAQDILAFAVRMLVIWIVLFALTTATVPPSHAP
jgi:hypothetical protein